MIISSSIKFYSGEGKWIRVWGHSSYPLVQPLLLSRWHSQPTDDNYRTARCSYGCVRKTLGCLRPQQPSISQYKLSLRLLNTKESSSMLWVSFCVFFSTSANTGQIFWKLLANWMCNPDVTVSQVATPIKNFPVEKDSFPQDCHYVLLKRHVM